MYLCLVAVFCVRGCVCGGGGGGKRGRRGGCVLLLVVWGVFLGGGGGVGGGGGGRGGWRRCVCVGVVGCRSGFGLFVVLCADCAVALFGYLVVMQSARACTRG